MLKRLNTNQCVAGLLTFCLVMLLALPGAAPLVTLAAAAYFLWLAWRIATAPPLTASPAGPGTAPRWYEGAGLSLVNPKAYAAMAALFSGHVLLAGPLAAAELRRRRSALAPALCGDHGANGQLEGIGYRGPHRAAAAPTAIAAIDHDVDPICAPAPAMARPAQSPAASAFKRCNRCRGRSYARSDRGLFRSRTMPFGPMKRSPRSL